MAPKNKGVQSTSVFPPPKPGPAQPRAHFGSQCSQRPQARVNQVSPPAFIVAELLNTDGDLDPAAQKLHFFFFFFHCAVHLPWMGNKLFSSWDLFVPQRCSWGAGAIEGKASQLGHGSPRGTWAPRSFSGAQGLGLGAPLWGIVTATYWEVHPLAQPHQVEAGYGGLSHP